MKPCLRCGTPANGTRCPTCQRGYDQGRRPSPRARGYDPTYRANRTLLLAGNPPCALCGGPDADTADHIIPTSKGGTGDIDNLRPAHKRCNSARGARTHP